MNASASSFSPPAPSPGLPVPAQQSARRAAFGGQLTQASVSVPDGPATSVPQQQGSHGKGQNKGKGKGKAKGAGAGAGAGAGQRETPPHQQQGHGGAHSRNSTRTTKHSSATAALANKSSALSTNGDASGDASPSQQTADETEAEEEEEVDEDNMCFICAETASLWAVGECNHRTCHTCSIRLRALYKKKECTFCKTECDKVIFTEEREKRFEEFKIEEELPFSDTRLGLLFETRSQLDSTISLLRFNCPSPSCSDVRSSWPDLKRHVRQAHQVSICDLCSYHLKIFSHEHSLRDAKEMEKHTREEHMWCDFCRRSFFGSEELYKHCRESHEECFLCVQAGTRHQYHLNYQQLEAHFLAAHHPCPHPTCLAQKFVVFPTLLDLQAHSLSVHGSSTSGSSNQSSRKEARRVETNFTSTFQSVDARSGGRSRAGNAGREPRREEAVASFARTEEGAPGPDGNTTRAGRIVPGLGAETRLANPGARDGAAAQSRRAAFGAALSAEGGAAAGASGAARQGVDAQVQERHEAVMRRVKEAVKGSEQKVTTFKLAVRSYRANEVSSDDLVDQLWNIFDQQQDVAGGIITSLADLFAQDDPEKRTSILSAWEGLRVEQTQFPSLTPLNPTANGIPTTARPTSSRNLNNRNPRNQRGGGNTAIWQRVEQAASSASPTPAQARARTNAGANAFPALSAPVVGMRPPARNTPWAGASSTPASAASSAPPSRGTTPLPAQRPTPVSAPPPIHHSASTLRPPSARSGQAFPALPVSQTEADRRARMRAAMGKPGGTVADGLSPGENNGGLWGASASGTSTRSGSPELRPAATTQQQPQVQQQQGKKKKGKVLLMSHGVLRG